MWNNYPGQGAPQQQQQGWGAPPPQGQPGGYGPPPGAPWGAPPPMPGGGYFSPPPGAPPPGGYPGQQPRGYDPGQQQGGYPGQQPGYPGPPGGNQGNVDQFSWNPRMGPPPNVHGQGGHGGGQGGYGGYSAPPGGPQQGYAAGGNWVPDHQGGQFYSAPMGTPHMPPSTPQYGGPPQAEQQYQYSQCTGRKKALCVGINYPGTDGELRGCINDAVNMKNFLIRRFGFKENDIVMLLDNTSNPRQIPTRQNIIDAMQWLVRDARPNDSLWFHYSGHGGQTKDLDGEEADGYDEVIYPADHEYAGHLEDDAMWDIMVRSLPPGCRLTAIFDSCHSGSVLDLPYIYSTEGKVKEPNQAAEIGKQALSAVKAYASKDMGSLFKAGMGAFKAATGSQQKAQKKAEAMRASPADVISWSGCKDSQTSADAFEAGAATGAMSHAFITSMDANPNQTYQQLLVSVREILKGKYQQKPQLSASHPMDTNILFIA